ncbi:hypothetical protein JCM11641_002388 [Rhodosporidiobolus odoratus]
MLNSDPSCPNPSPSPIALQAPTEPQPISPRPLPPPPPPSGPLPTSPCFNPFIKSATALLNRDPSLDPPAPSLAPPLPPRQQSHSLPRSALQDMTGRSTRRASSRAASTTANPAAQDLYQPTANYSTRTRRSSRGASSSNNTTNLAHRFSYNEDDLAGQQGLQAEGAGRRSGRGRGRVSYNEDAYGEDSDGGYQQSEEQDAQNDDDDQDAQGEEEEEDDEGADDGEGAYEPGQPQWPMQVQGMLPPLPPAQAYAAQPQQVGAGGYYRGDQQQQQQQPVRTGLKLTFRIPDHDQEAQGDGEGEEQDAPGEVDEGAEGMQNGHAEYGALAGSGCAGENGIAPGEVYDPGAVGDGGYHQQQEEEEEVVGGRSLRPRARNSRMVLSSDEEEQDEYGSHVPQRITTTTASGRTTKRPQFYGEDDEEEVKPAGGRRGLRRGGGNVYGGDYVEQEDGGFDGDDGDEAYGARPRTRNASATRRSTRGQERALRERGEQARQSLTQPSRPKPRMTRNSRRASAADQSYEGGSDVTTDDEMLDLANESEESAYGDDRGGAPAKRTLRNKPKVNYYTLPPLEAPKGKKDKGKGVGRRRMDQDGNPFAGLPANMTGAMWAELYPDGGQPSDSSDDDDMPSNPLNSPRKNALFSGAGAMGAGGGGMLAGGGMDFGSGAPSNMGKVGNAAALADTDPLGVPTSISFDSVGGLGSHIQQLKEMVSLPLLYPEVFERFAITPPRGVLFHGPPGTGKTLLARALAASCSTEGRKISFFMRKGADCLSKWVGEAERQLRLLFEEARACQPSIIFFDEIDGLAPVRSSKQEQIHASIVSTLLALMDGMDGRGQVIIIGATNRPDAIDPALRRPGRFDREFYFPLPNVEARRKILEIHTNGWKPGLEGTFLDELAKITKGYGGADLRALCTEAALNAVQRTYPQIYKTNDRLLIKPEQIGVTARDFVLSQKNLIPSTARSTSSSAAPLPPQLVPLLADALENAKEALTKVLPDVKKISVLEEAEFVEEGGGFEKEKMMQAFETLRVYRPRLLICGEPGQGQPYVAAAVLHHLEGFHVQSLDLATLVSDSTRTMEASCVQLFTEAKRHKPSILFIPQLSSWCTSVGETVRATIKGLLDGLDPSDPILLLAIVDGQVSDLPADVRSWFGFVKGNRVVLGKPGPDQRRDFFADVLAGIRRPPNEYPDAVPRRRRVLEKLPIAPPPPPREPTAAELAQQEQNDLRLLEYLKWKLGPVLAELKKRYKRFQRCYYRDWKQDDLEWRAEQHRKGETVTGLGTQPYHNVDLDSMHSDLYKGYYYTPDDFVTDILRIQHNAEVNKIMENDGEAPIRAGQMVNHVKVMLDQTFDTNFRAECEKMAMRMRDKGRDQQRMDKDKKRGKGGEVAADGMIAAAKEAAVAGGLNARHRSAGPGEEDEVEVVEGVGVGETAGEEGEGERQLKRVREEGEGDAMEGIEQEDGQGPPKRPRQDGEDGVAAVDLADGQAVASGSGPIPLPNGNVLTATSATLNDLLNPTSHSALPTFTTTDAASHFSQAPAQHNPSAAPDFAPFMPVGSVPSISPRPVAQPATSLPAHAPGSVSFLTGAIPGPSAAANPFSPSPAKTNGDANLRAFPFAASNGAVSRETTPTPAPLGANGTLIPDSQLRRSASVEQASVPGPSQDGAATQGEQEPEVSSTRTPTPMAATPPPLPDFILDSFQVDAFASLLVDRTSSLNVDQLEQLRAACFDTVWRLRARWDRKGMVEELEELVREFVEEVEAL